MADNTTLPGTGDVIAADDVSGIKYQQMKLVDGTLNSSAVIPGDATNGLDVDVTRVQGTVTVAGTATVTGNKAEDAAAVDGDAGLPILGVRNDSATARTSTDGDYGMVALDSAGRVGVSDLGGAISVDDNSGSLTVDNGGTFAVQATVAAGATNVAKAEDVASADADVGIPAMAVRKATPANTSGTDGDYEMLQLSAGRLWVSATVDTALPAGSNAIGKLAANSGVDIGALTANQTVNVAQINGVTTTMGNGASGTGVQRVTLANDSTGVVDKIVTSIVPGTSATHLGKAEDVAHADGDTGVAVWSVRQDTPATTSGTTGDYSAFTTDANGALHVAVVGKNVENWVEVTIAGLTTASTTYTSGDVLGGEMTFTNAARFSGGTAAIDKIIAINNSVQLGAVDAFIFDQASTPASDNAANSWSDANMAHCVGVVPLYPAATSALNQVLSWSAAGGEKIKCNSTSTFIVFVTRSDSTFFAASTDLLVKVNFVRS